MSAIQFWKELVITQTCTGSISLIASSAIVGFISKKGLDNPYRRLIFGLSIADIFQSGAIVAGPWLNESDVPQALWGIGNIHTCRLDGFLFLVGGSAAPMYTLAICIYYMCKLKMKMADDRFVHRVEKRMHAIIITLNLGLYLTALGMDTINSSVNGTICLPAAIPTGCRQNPQIFGKCDPDIETPSAVFSLIFSLIIPIVCILGVLICFAIIFWHVLVREKIFGVVETTSKGGSGGVAGGSATPVRRRSRCLRSNIESSKVTTNLGRNNKIGPQEIVKNSKCEEGDADDSIQFPAKQVVQSIAADPLTDCECQATDEDASTQRNPGVQSTSNLMTDVLGDDRKPSANEAILAAQEASFAQETANSRSTTADMESLSRLYKKELLTQAISYGSVFCLTGLPFLIVLCMLGAGGKAPPRFMYRIVYITFPLAGFFNIIESCQPQKSTS